MAALGFAVIDFETTGLFPGGHDRVVEVAIVHLDSDGRIGDRWDTLVNPGRDLGAQQIHHISASEILEAPTFAQIAPRLVELLTDRVVVAHNASFDVRFLLAELDRLGYPAVAPVSLCTMQLAREFLPGAGRSLQDCCDAFDIELDGAHRASVDALATAQLLECYLLHNPNWVGWADAFARAAFAWPALRGENVEWCPRGTQHADPRTFLQRITVKMPDHSGPTEQHDYLALLDRCMLDHDISAHEADSLVNLAEGLGISRTTCAELHGRYFEDLVDIAWADGHLASSEIADLAAVALALGIADEIVVDAMRPRTPLVAPTREFFALARGDLIVLTGEMRRPRADWETDIRAHGYVPWAAITKKVKLLAAADADTISGKARKAREYGIAVVDEDGLSRLLGR